ncbi:ATP-NAD kinase family protein [Halobaculum sp. MBLA0147]|uniref:ATP-NAD kinase family protein n=1 Tax=Halobaculum sp. MBLA0147 TaxID=3079934 RepID=UPI0035231B73
MRVGFLCNPIAGMGGRVGLKGTDGKLAEARERGADPRAPERAVRALRALADRDADVDLLVWGGPMGETAARAAGLSHEVLGAPEAYDRETDDGGETTTTLDLDPDRLEATGPDDTRAAARAFHEAGVDLVLFVGGDGTAADVAAALDGTETPMLGVPAGVKVYSAVFAVSPEDAAAVATQFDRTERREVTDIDEDEYREGAVHPELQGVAFVPVTDRLQSSKQSGGGTVESLAAGVADEARDHPERTYVLGPGSTLAAVKAELGFEGSPIGVDVWRDGEVLARDADEATLLELLDPDGDNEIVVTPIGGQGFVFGRGNPQLSPAVIRRADVSIVASRDKLDDLHVLHVDTDDPELDETLAGWVKVRVGRFETRMLKIV